MLVALYSSGPKAGQLASTADAIRGFPGRREVVLAELGIRANKMPKSLRSALSKQTSPTYPVEYRSPTLERKASTNTNLANEHLPMVPASKRVINTESLGLPCVNRAS